MKIIKPVMNFNLMFLLILVYLVILSNRDDMHSQGWNCAVHISHVLNITSYDL
jgi:hypothetical protein